MTTNEQPHSMSGAACEVLFFNRQSIQEGAYPTERPRAIHAEDAARARAVAVDPERGDTANDIAAANEVWTARVAEAGAARVGVIRKQDRIVAGETWRVDLDQTRGRHITDAYIIFLPRCCIGEAFL